MRTTAAAALAFAIASTSASTSTFAADLDFGPLRGSHWGEPVVVWQGGYFAGFAGTSAGRLHARQTLRDAIANDLRLSVPEGQFRVSTWLQPQARSTRAATYGVIAGYNFQFGEAVLGFEADFSTGRLRLDASDRLARRVLYEQDPGATIDVRGSARAEITNTATLRARAGYTLGAFLPFVTGGLALATYESTTNASVLVTYRPDPNFPVTVTEGDPNISRRASGVAFGLAGGAGLDVALTENVFVRGEWQYLYFPDVNSARVDVNTLRAAAGVRF